jgi:Ca2+-binding RTX toxin-like protein
MANIDGSSSGETLVGTSGPDVIRGFGGNDTLIGDAGADRMEGGTGDDVFYVDNPNDVVIELAGEGSDLVYTSVSYALGIGQEIEVLSAIANYTSEAIDLYGNEIANTLLGNQGANLLYGGAGADTMYGFGGDDTYYVDNAGDRVIEGAGGGNDVVYTSISYALAAGTQVETLSTVANYTSEAIDLYGNEFANRLLGNQGANLLYGGGGADAMYGFGGDDTYYVDNAGDQVFEGGGGGNDVVYTSISYALGAGQQIEMLSTVANYTSEAIDLYGNEIANTLLGNQGANLLYGGAGADAMYGFGGDDTYYVDNAADQVFEGAGGGNDVVYTSISYALAAGTQVETLSTVANYTSEAIDLYGNEFANRLLGNQGANLLYGGGGADAMYGFGGDDTYYVDNAGDQVFEGGGGGNDVVYTSISYALGAGQQIEMLSTVANYTSEAIDLYGNEIANTLLGNQGANLLYGGAGADAMYGFGGDDTYYVDNAADQVFEGAGGGNDVLYTSVSYALAAGQQIETFSTVANYTSEAIDLTGNELANTLLGNAGVNVLNGGAGADTLYGFGGADSFAFTTALGVGNVDVIADFAVGIDKIQLGGATGQPFFTLATGGLRVGTLVIGTAAVDADDYLIYNSATGALLYDADGAGGAAAVQFATLSTGLNLTVADFTVSGAANTAPAITSGATASVAENSSASTIVYQTAATDADGDRITYSLSGTDANLLSIDANGAVRLNSSADFETKNSYVFNVIASDSGVATVKAVTLTITDVADSASTPIINETQGSNDTQQTAQSLDPNSFVIANNPNLVNAAYPSAEIHGSISTPTDTGGVSNDVDYYSITLTAGQQLILDVDINPANGLDSFLSLYGPDGVLIGDQDDLISPDPGSGTQFGHNTDSQIIFRASTSGTYYFSIKSFATDNGQATSKGDYTLNVSINNTPATAAQIIADDVQALISGTSWNHNGPAFNLTYGFPSLGSYYPSSFDEVSSAGPGDPTPTFQAFSATQQAATRSLLQLVANVTQITFTENTTQGQYDVAGTAANANIRYARSSEVDPGAAYAYLPTNGGPSSTGGSAWFNINSQNANFNSPARGNYAWMGILHETGHALGLKHGHEFPLAISPDHDSVEYSIMTYRSYPGASTTGGYSNEQWGYAQTLMMLDIAALQKIYGSANYAFNSGNSVYTWNATSGEMSINGVGQGAPGNGDGITQPGENRVFMTVWDGNGEDTYDLSNYSSSVIDLRPGEWTTTSSTQLANLGQGHMARGNVANALLFEGDTRSAIENAIGGSGNDTLIANLVANKLTGNLGTDTFKWVTTGDAGTGNKADTVLDFVRGADKIDFTSLDANPATGAHDAFTFIGTSAFHNVAGEVRYDVTGGSAHIFADVDGNGTADMEIVLTNVTTLAATDFNF